MWNSDIEAAPHGRTEALPQTRVHSGREVEVLRSAFIPDYVWLATKCGKVIKSCWIPAKGRDGDRWHGLNKGEQPVAWMLFVTPEHPFGDRDDARVDIAAILSSEHLPMINDVGGI